MVVLNEDRTVESRQIIDAFVNTETFQVVGEVPGVDGLKAFIRQGKAYVGLQIPPNFARDLRAGKSARIQVLIDGSNSTTALQALNTALGAVMRRSLDTLLRETCPASGQAQLNGQERPPLPPATRGAAEARAAPL